jgi:uncharacterized protein YndB with AHSA1/START domain
MDDTRQSDPKTVIERSYATSIDDIWKLWTTREGIESWWGPEGFSVKVHQLDLQPGGEMRYVMTAVHAPQIEFMQRAGMPVTTEAKLAYTAIVPEESLAYLHRVDFAPGIPPYDAGTKVEFFADGPNVRIVLTLDPMHNDEWTRRSVMGMESQLAKLTQAARK